MATMSADAVRQFNDQGYYAPIRALTGDEAARLRSRLEAFEASNSGLDRGTPQQATSAFYLAETNWIAIPACSTRWSR